MKIYFVYYQDGDMVAHFHANTTQEAKRIALSQYGNCKLCYRTKRGERWINLFPQRV